MKYIDYINLGFTREDINDSVEFNETGYHGFYLIKNLGSNVSIQSSSCDLDRPKLYIPKEEMKDNFYIVTLTEEALKELF